VIVKLTVAQLFKKFYFFRGNEGFITCLLTYLFTLWRRVLLEKLTVFRLVKKFSKFYGTRRFITAFTSAANWPYSEPDQSSSYPHIPLIEDPS